MNQEGFLEQGFSRLDKKDPNNNDAADKNDEGDDEDDKHHFKSRQREISHLFKAMINIQQSEQ